MTDADVIREGIYKLNRLYSPRGGGLAEATAVDLVTIPMFAALDSLVAEREEARKATQRVREAHGDLVASTMVPLVRGGTFRDVLDRCEKLEAALRTIQAYYEAVYAPGDQAYQAAIVARAALEDTP